MAVHNTQFLVCRDLGHAWDYRGGLERVDSGLFQRRLVCTRCGTERADRYGFDGEGVRPKANSYAYPKGYVVKGGLSRAEARAFLFFPKTMRKKGAA